MDAVRIIAQLKQLYPNKKIISIPEDNPREIILEHSRSENPSMSVALAVIEQSLPHYHKEISEIYQVQSGTLTVYIHSRPNVLHRGDQIIISPYQPHYAQSDPDDPAWVWVVALPQWRIEDHILI